MAKVENCLKLLQLLINNDILSSNEIEKELNVTGRQVRTYIDTLKASGFDVGSKSGLNGGYFMSRTICPLCHQKRIK